MELFSVILLYGVLWGAFHFWGYGKTAREVLSNPGQYSPRKVNFYKRLTFFPQAALSFLTALACWIIAKLLSTVIHLL
jgi:hypothetical protein